METPVRRKPSPARKAAKGVAASSSPTE
jgi:AcrR family transcriptional regulator